MRNMLLLVMFSSFCHFVIAGDVINKSGSKCPSGYRDGKGAYCYKNSATDDKKVLVKEDGKCPQGYRDGKGAYCYGSATAKNVVVKQGGECPGGYNNGPGAYCYQALQ